MKETSISDTAPISIEIALAPRLMSSDAEQRRVTVFIVIDVIRATTTLTVALDRGCRSVTLAPDIPTAEALARHSSGRFLVGGEREGIAPPGFDLGNSPSEYARADLDGRDLLFVTTNGTRALRACAGGHAIFAGAFCNAEAVAEGAALAALRARELPAERTEDVWRDHADITLVCAGRGGLPSYDDTLCAGYLVRCVRGALERLGHAARYHEGARIAVALDEALRQSGVSTLQALASSEAGQAVARLGLADDLAICATADTCDAVPWVAGEAGGQMVLHRWPGQS